ncbi:hypothetical protein PISMIDRAFT_616021 [Pisolithus microcarpus 441]|uniref:Uncharacterized protein n=1 Tax=Pisolithus microcarpus 441 TaxID=765257 RepID=A0A0C9Y5I7_9AGAM|nr:hypothetical protein PISMIDRAFT_616021 [Pisolithus microcarpus 441]
MQSVIRAHSRVTRGTLAGGEGALCLRETVVVFHLLIYPSLFGMKLVNSCVTTSRLVLLFHSCVSRYV